MADTLHCDLAILGGGLAGGLAALAFAARHPDVRLLLVEQGPALGGNHIWSFFDGDIPADQRWLVDPLVTHRWPAGHAVRFPGYQRQLKAPYNSIASPRFDAHLRTTLGPAILTDADVATVTPNSVTLTDGRRITAAAVLDARGPADLSVLDCGWQKFAGQTLRLAQPHGLDRPVIMDATVDQIDGYRFVYLLPSDDRTIFVEDTYYSDTPDLPVAAIGSRIATYAAAQGWQVEQVTHQETGVLPVVYGGDFARYWPATDPVARIGARAGLFHPLTGYSLPDAVATALWLADQPLESLATATRARAAAHWRAGGYYRFLARMLFQAAAPQDRWRIFARFYRLPQALVGRFYAGRSTPADKARILCGRPPVPIRAAMHAVWNHLAR
jgi:lycopene beta-cyclase